MSSRAATRRNPAICIAVSGADGSGKSFTAVNLAAAIAIQIKRVLLLDMNPFPGNSSEMSGLTPEQGQQLSFGRLNRGICGLDVLRVEPESPAAERMEPTVRQFIKFISDYNAIIVDCRNRFRNLHNSFVSIAPKIIMVTDENQESFKQTYSLTKALTMEHISSNISLVVNRAATDAHGEEIAAKLDAAAVKFLARHYELLTVLPLAEITFNPVFGPKPLVSLDINAPTAKKLVAASKYLLQRRDIFMRFGESDIPRIGNILFSKPSAHRI